MKRGKPGHEAKQTLMTKTRKTHRSRSNRSEGRRPVWRLLRSKNSAWPQIGQMFIAGGEIDSCAPQERDIACVKPNIWLLRSWGSYFKDPNSINIWSLRDRRQSFSRNSGDPVFPRPFLTVRRALCQNWSSEHSCCRY